MLHTHSYSKGAGEDPPKGGPLVLLDPPPFLKPSCIYSYFCVCGVGRGVADSRGGFPSRGFSV